MIDRKMLTPVAAAYGCVGMVIGYPAVRVLGVLLGERELPAALLWTEHSAYRWSLLIAVWIAGMAALGARTWAGRDPLAAGRWLTRAIAVATVLILVQGLLVP
jgi:hypothetical protein